MPKWLLLLKRVDGEEADTIYQLHAPVSAEKQILSWRDLP